MNLMLTESESKALAEALHSMRPDWGIPGIHKALGQARWKANKWVVAQAAFACAANQSNRTPAIIPLDGKHWPLMPMPEKPPPPRPKRELSEEEREAAHRQYLAAKAILNGRKSNPEEQPCA